MPSYQAIKEFHIGRANLSVRRGDYVHWDGGDTARVGERTFEVLPGLMNQVILVGWLKVVETFALQLANAPSPAPVASEPDEPPVPFFSPATKAADGKRPEAKKAHIWEGGASGWLNSDEGLTCVVCGVTKLAEGRLINVDRQRGNGKQMNQYRDAHGVSFSSFEELSCPAYIGDAASAAAQTKEVVRNVRGQVDEVEGRVGGVEDRVESVEERLSRLEGENMTLREQLNERPMVDATEVAQALVKILEARKLEQADPKLITETITVEALEAAQRERELVPVEEKKADG